MTKKYWPLWEGAVEDSVSVLMSWSSTAGWADSNLKHLFWKNKTKQHDIKIDFPNLKSVFWEITALVVNKPLFDI